MIYPINITSELDVFEKERKDESEKYQENKKLLPVTCMTFLI